MPLHQTDAYVLRTYALKEADKICVLLTREAGKIRGVAQGAKRLRSRFGSSLEPFTEVSISYFQKENRELVSISTCEIIRSQFRADLSGEVLGMIHYLAELVIEFVPDHEPNERVYRLVTAALEVVRIGNTQQLMALARYCEIWMLRLSGFLPDFKHCSNCHLELGSEGSAWLAPDGSPQCVRCSDQQGQELRSDARQTLADILGRGPMEFAVTNREPRALAQIGAIAGRLIHRTLERELKSLEFLSQLRPARNAIGRQ
ncbi:MAG: DNA repair protein RecO [Acidobacteriota bacterium]